MTSEIIKRKLAVEVELHHSATLKFPLELGNAGGKVQRFVSRMALPAQGLVCWILSWEMLIVNLNR